MNQYSESQIRYFEMLQQLIQRMANNSFLLKGWDVTLMAAVFALTSNNYNNLFMQFIYVPNIIFWCLDAYYLQIERKYRILYNNKIINKSDEVIFELKIPQSSKLEKTCFLQCFFSKTEVLFYFPIFILTLTYIILFL